MQQSYLEAVIIDGISNYIKVYQPTTASEIAYQTGWSKAQVNAVVAALLKTNTIAAVGVVHKTQEPLYCTVSSTLGYRRTTP